MKRRRVMLIVAGVLVAVVVAILVWPGEREPVYQGKRLSEWLELYLNTGKSREPSVAVRHIGTNAVPWLLEWLEHNDLPNWKLGFLRSAEKLPRAVRDSSVFRKAIRFVIKRPSNVAAINGFEILGTDARSAIPALTRMMNDSMNRGRAVRATLALVMIGKDAIPALLGALTDVTQHDRAWIAGSFGFMGDVGTNGNRLATILVGCLKEENEALRNAAGRSLGRLGVEPEIVIPALAAALHDPKRSVRMEVASSIGEFGERARYAENALLEAANDPDEGVRWAVTNALRRVEGKPDLNQLE